MALGRRRFRPMGFGDILDEAFDLYKSNFVLLVGIAAVLYVPAYFLFGFSMVAYIDAMLKVMGSSPDMESLRSLQGSGRILLPLLIIFGQAVVLGAFTYAISERYLGRATTIRKSYAFVLRRLGPFLMTCGAFLLAALGALLVFYIGLVINFILAFTALSSGPVMVVIGLISGLTALGACGVLSAILVFRFALAFPVFIAEDRRYFSSLGRAWALSAGSSWRVFGLMTLSYVVLGVIWTIIFIPAGGVVMSAVRAGNDALAGSILGVAYALIGTILAPIISVVLIVLYYDLRIRKEGFDLQMLAKELAQTNGESTQEMSPAESPQI